MAKGGYPYAAYPEWKIWMLFKITGLLGICIKVVPPRDPNRPDFINPRRNAQSSILQHREGLDSKQAHHPTL